MKRITVFTYGANSAGEPVLAGINIVAFIAQHRMPGGEWSKIKQKQSGGLGVGFV